MWKRFAVAIAMVGCGASYGDKTADDISECPKYEPPSPQPPAAERFVVLAAAGTYYDRQTQSECAVGMAVAGLHGLCAPGCIPIMKLRLVCYGPFAERYYVAAGPVGHNLYGAIAVNRPGVQCGGLNLPVGPLVAARELPDAPYDCTTLQPLTEDLYKGRTTFRGVGQCFYPLALPQ